jgi:GNAT superfamily N-acetyltransferase
MSFIGSIRIERTMPRERLCLFDTPLRDGAQTNGVDFTLADNTRIDMLYVHPAASGQGAGAMLCDALEKLAAARGAKELTVDASDCARGFFEKRGFVARTRNTVALAGEWLANTTMTKTLAPPTRRSAS